MRARRSYSSFGISLARVVSSMLVCSAARLTAQQIPDTSFTPTVPRPAFAEGKGPALCLDEGHFNFHTLDNRFLAFGKLARRDGFRVSPLQAVFSAAALADCRLLVISNAQSNARPWDMYSRPTPSAFTD